MSIAVRGAPGEALKHLETASRFARGVVDSVAKVITDFYWIAALNDMGDGVATEREARALLASPGADAVPYLRSWSLHTLGHALLHQNRFDEAIALAESLVSTDDALFVQRARSLLAQTYLAAGQLDKADHAAAIVIEGAPSPQDKAAGLTVASAVALSRGESAKAVASSRVALELVRQSGCTAATSSMIECAHVEALLAAGDPELDAVLEATVARVEGVARSLALASPQYERSWRQSSDNARLLTIADERRAASRSA